MATFISSLVLYGFLATIVGFVRKLIYDTQQNKKQPKLRKKHPKCAHDLAHEPWLRGPASEPASQQPASQASSTGPREPEVRGAWREMAAETRCPNGERRVRDVTAQGTTVLRLFVSRQQITSRGHECIVFRVLNRMAGVRVAAKGNFAPVRTAHVREMAQMRPPCFAAGSAPS